MRATQKLNDALRQEAVDDLLKCLQRPHRAVNRGWLLAPELLAHLHEHDWNEYDLRMALQNMVQDMLGQYRRDLDMEKIEELQPAAEQLRRDVARKHPPLAQLSLVWAYYVEQLDMETLHTASHYARRSIELKLSQGRTAIARQLAEHARATQSAVHHADELSSQHQESLPSPAPQPDQHNAVQPEEAAFSIPGIQPSLVQHVERNSGIVVGNNFQGKIVQHAPSSSRNSDPQRTFWNNDLTARMATLIFCLVVFFAIWLWDNVSLVSVGIMLVLSIVQTLRHSWIAGSAWRNHMEPNIRWWHISYAAMWGGLSSWFVFVLMTLQPVTTSPTPSLASFWSIVWFTCGSVVLVAFGALEGMFYLSGVANPDWPWHMFKQAADDTWEQRWVMVFVGWMLLVVLFVSAVGIESFGVASALIR